ncbi:MAG TPA: hypothetical protein VGG05_11355 [Pseudonocardiaceae bacterium]|jgi:hypothetical protein
MTGDPPAGPRLLGALRSADGKGVVRRSRLAHGLGRPDELVIEATLTADGEQTILVVEEWGTPLNLTAAHGAGIQVHVEDLTAHIAGRERCDADSRWDELEPAYDVLAADIA